MKMTPQKMMWLLFVAFAFTSCAKDDDNGGPDTGGGGQLLVTETKADGKTRARSDYDSQNRLKTIYLYNEEGDQIATITYTYDSRGRLSVVTNQPLEGSVAEVEEYTYGDGDKPVSMVQTVSGGADPIAYDWQFDYSSNKLVETVTPRSPIHPPFKNTYTYSDGGDLLSMEVTLNEVWASTVEYGDYDDKNTPDRLGNPYAWKFPNRHNYRTYKITNSDPGANVDRLLKYTYNDAGYPIKVETYNQGSDAVVETLEYIYKNAN